MVFPKLLIYYLEFQTGQPLNFIENLRKFFHFAKKFIILTQCFVPIMYAKNYASIIAVGPYLLL